MSHGNRVIALAGCLAAFSIIAVIRAQQPAPPPQVDAQALRNAGTPADSFPGSWLSYGRTQNETRYSPLKLIDTSNVNRLGLTWSYALGAGGGNQEGTPLVWNNTLYGITTWSVVFAVDARTGKELWRWDPEVNQPAVRPRICCGIVNRGLALYEGMIFAPAIDGRLIALDALNGKPIWEARVAFPQDLYTITMAPRVANGKVIVGVSGGDKPTRGFFDAYDAKTGRRAWRFYTVPGDPSKPYENEALRAASKTWGGDFYTRGGGGAVWDGVAYDPETNIVYVGTGNAEPWVQKFRGAQHVDNLYTCSILAVDLNTGQLKWHYQTVPNDNWDFDSVQQLMLLNLTINGRQRKVIAQAAKDGFFYVLDRASGEFISAAPFVKVDWATGFDERGRPMVNPEAYYDTEGVEIFPTGGGAHNWSAMSFNPATNLVYINASYSPFLYQATEELKPGSTGYVRPSGEVRHLSKSIGPVAPDGVRGGLQAWDPVNQKLAWRADGGGGIGGGTVTTAGNLVFQVINDGTFRAYSADKGEKLFEAKTGRTGMGPPITYEAGGKQYVAFLGGLGRVANVTGPTNDKVEFPPMLFVFELDGKQEFPKAAPAPAGRGPAPPAPEQVQTQPAGQIQSLSHAIHAVGDLDTTLAFYRDVFGLRGNPQDFPNPAVPLLTNAPGVTLRMSMLALPGKMRFELTHFKGVERKPGQAHYTDPGAASIVFHVRDIDTALANAKAAHAPILTTGGLPVEITTSTGSKARSIILRDPDGFFVQLIQDTASTDANPADAPEGNVHRVSLAYTMESAESTEKFYGGMMGVELSGPTSFSKDPALLQLYGAPAGTEFRKLSGVLPGPPAAVEFTEFRGVPRSKFHLRVRDPGAPAMAIQVVNLVGMVAQMKAAGTNLISANGELVDFGNGIHNIFVEDPNGMNLELFERAAK